MAARAIQAGVYPGEREEVVLEVPARPTDGGMASLTISRPAVRLVIGGLGACKTPLMAELALRGCPTELADGRLEVTALTGGHRMSRNQMKACPGVLGD